MKKKRDRLIKLSLLLTRKKLYRLLQYDVTLEKVNTFTSTQLEHLLHISPEKASSIIHSLQCDHDDATIQYTHKNYYIITIFDSMYPPSLKGIPDAPLVLYCLGDLTLLQQNKLLSVIGTRKPTATAPQKLLKVVSPLIEQNWAIVSGMAYGIDSLAHQLALHMQGKTIAILGSGFHHIYPKENMTLFWNIVENGLVLSEYPPYVKPKKYQFPERNRIISGLSYGTLVIEAKEKSGTLITVDQALEQGKEVFAIPDSLFVEEAAGCLKLIDQGAKLVTNAEDIIENLPGK